MRSATIVATCTGEEPIVIDQPEIVQAEVQPAAIIRFTIPRDQIAEVMGPGIGELVETAMAQGIGPAGPVFSHHLRMEPGIWDFELGVPVSGPVSPTGRVVAGELPAARVVRTVYHGNYDGLGDGWGELDAWIGAQGLSTGPNLWERYVAGPESSDDPADWRTELNRPLVESA
jgi:effector-binding domain-containing protein